MQALPLLAHVVATLQRDGGLEDSKLF
jgi:hypothetical protein